MKHFSIDPGKDTLTINQKIKNSTEQRMYEVRDWPGNSVIQSSVYMDLFVALLSQVKMREVTDGSIFCDIKKFSKGFHINQGAGWSSSKFTAFLRERPDPISVASADVKIYSGHSLKRGYVQLYRSLNVCNERIMKLFKIKFTTSTATIRQLLMILHHRIYPDLHRCRTICYKQNNLKRVQYIRRTFKT